ncbi:MAG: translation initiation factor IF-2 [Desulfovibrio sp.]
MADKVRVKDLATELGVNNKDVLHELRDLGISVKSHMSSLGEDDAAKVREVLKKDGASKTKVRKVQDGVVVRRRKPKKEAESEPHKEAQKEAPKEAKKVAKAADEAPKKAAPKETAAEAEKPAKGEKAPQKKKKAAAPKEEKAKIIKKPEAAPTAKIVKPAKEEKAVKEEPKAAPEKPAQAEPKQEKEAAPKQKKQAPKQEKAPKADKAQSEKADAKPAKEAQPKKKAKKKKEAPASPQVRVISRPDPNQVQEQKAARQQPRSSQGQRPGGGRPGGGRPGGPGRPGGGGGRPGGPGRPGGGGGRPGGPGRPGGGGGRPGGGGGYRPSPSAAPVPPKEDSRKKRGKGRRVVDFNNNTNKEDRAFPGNNRKGKKGKKGKRNNQRMEQPTQQVTTQPLKAAKRKVRFDEAIRVSDLAQQMSIKAQAVIKTLFGLGVMATINQSLDFDTTIVVAAEFGYEVENVSFDEQEFLIPQEVDSPEDMKRRPPVVTIMGHVDHGKTSLLDAIRSTNVTDGEAGGITQHIGAYHVQTKRGEVVFLDTPGHEAFTTMRMRGAQVTDIVILVVAADDGVMEQTREAISHSKAAGVPIVVAVNKIDKEGANPDNVKRELAEFDLVPEEWGGDTIYTYVSAKKREGLDGLLEMVLLQAEVLDLKANPDKPARGHIVEAKLDKGRGPVGTMLITEGTIRQSDCFVCGVQHGKIRAMLNDQGKKIKSAGPAMPVELQGFNGIPEAGDELAVVKDEKLARRIAEARLLKQREKELAGKSKVTLESFLASSPDKKAEKLNVILKADVQGSLEAVDEAIQKLSTDEVKINVVHGAAGAITESDILLASASQAIIIGFNIRPTVKVKDIAEQENVEIRFYDIIYKLVAEVKDAMSGMLSPDIKEVYLGQAEVRETFSVPKVGTIAGCMIADGKLTRHAQIRLLREGVVIYTGQLASLKRFKDDVKEVAKGYECGVGLERFNDIKVGDFLEAFEEEEVAREL